MCGTPIRISARTTAPLTALPITPVQCHVRLSSRGRRPLEDSCSTQLGSATARVDNEVVFDTFVDDGPLRISLTCPAIRTQRFPCPRNFGLEIAAHANPQDLQTSDGRSQKCLTSPTVKEHLIDNDAGSADGDRCDPPVPRHLEASPPWTDLDLSGVGEVQGRSIVDPTIGNGPDQIISAEEQPRCGEHRLRASSNRGLACRECAVQDDDLAAEGRRATRPPITPGRRDALMAGSDPDFAFQTICTRHSTSTGLALLTLLTGCGAVQSSAPMDSVQTRIPPGTVKARFRAINSEDG
jgi:hypothetical protein